MAIQGHRVVTDVRAYQPSVSIGYCARPVGTSLWSCYERSLLSLVDVDTVPQPPDADDPIACSITPQSTFEAFKVLPAFFVAARAIPTDIALPILIA